MIHLSDEQAKLAESLVDRWIHELELNLETLPETTPLALRDDMELSLLDALIDAQQLKTKLSRFNEH